MLVLLAVTAVVGVVCFMLGRAFRLNRCIKAGTAMVNLDTGEVFEPGSPHVREGRVAGIVEFKDSEDSK